MSRPEAVSPASGGVAVGDVIAVLEKTALLAEVPRPALAELAPSCVPVWLDDRAYLFRAAEAADHVYFIAKGQLEVIRPAHGEEPELLLNTRDSGAVLGELAVLRGEKRSAGVRARGRTLVLGVTADRFIRFVHEWPQVAVAIARAIAESFVRVEQRLLEPAAARLWVVVAGAPLDETFAFELAQAAQALLGSEKDQRAAVLFAAGARDGVRDGIELRALPDGDNGSTALADATSAALEHAALVVICGPAQRVSSVLRRAHAVVAPDGANLPPLAEEARHIEIIESGPPSATRVRLGRQQPRREVAARVARLLLRRSIGVALGGGAARAYAELGVLQVMHEIGVPIDFVAGSSMGAIIGAMFLANGLEGALAEVRRMDRRIHWLRLVDPAIFFSGMVSGKRLSRILEEKIPVQLIEELSLPFGSVSVNLDTGEEHVAREGRITDALLAGVSIPGIFAPYVYAPMGASRTGRYVDGGMVNNVPVDVVRAMGADKVVALCPLSPGPQPTHEVSPLMRWLAYVPTISRAMTLLEAQHIQISHSGARQLLTADVGIIPQTAEFGFIEFWRIHELLVAGRQAGEGKLAELRALIA